MDSRQQYALCPHSPAGFTPLETKNFCPPTRQGYGSFRQSFTQSDMLLLLSAAAALLLLLMMIMMDDYGLS